MGITLRQPMHPQIRCSHTYSLARHFERFCLVGRVFCKKGCGADGDTWDENVSVCDQICNKDPVLKDQQWSSYTDRSPGDASYSEFEMPAKKVEECHVPNRACKPPAVPKPAKRFVAPQSPVGDDMPGTSA